MRLGGRRKLSLDALLQSLLDRDSEALDLRPWHRETLTSVDVQLEVDSEESSEHNPNILIVRSKVLRPPPTHVPVVLGNRVGHHLGTRWNHADGGSRGRSMHS
jgi:hypothetical protein